VEGETISYEYKPSDLQSQSMILTLIHRLSRGWIYEQGF
jgi:hypothetical protein